MNYKIAMLIARFYPIEGGAEIQCKRLSSWLNESGCNVFVLTQKMPNLARYEAVDGMLVYRLGMAVTGLIGSFIYIVHAFIWLCKNLRNVDILHAHLASSPAVLAGVVSKLFNKPSILKFAGSRLTGDISTSSKTWYGKLKLRFLQKNISMFVCPSKEIYSELISAGFPKERITVIPNGVDTQKYLSADDNEKKLLRKQLGLNEDAVIVMYCGRLEHGKGLEVLLEAWKNISSNININLIIIGSGSLENAIKNNASNNVFMYGWKKNAIDYYRASDIFILPSFGEGLPNALIEAMACGLACISTNIGGVTDLIVNQENGILTEPGNTAELQSAIMELIENKKLAQLLAANARKYIEQNLSKQKITKDYMDIYSQILAVLKK